MRVTEKQESKGKYRERQKGPREQRVSGFMERKRNWERLRMRGGGGGGEMEEEEMEGRNGKCQKSAFSFATLKVQTAQVSKYNEHTLYGLNHIYTLVICMQLHHSVSMVFHQHVQPLPPVSSYR